MRNRKEKNIGNNHHVVVFLKVRWKKPCVAIARVYGMYAVHVPEWAHIRHSSLFSSHLLYRFLQVWLRRAMHGSERQKKDLIHFRLGRSLQ